MSIARIFDLFSAPDAFGNDPYKWFGSQVGHGYLGVGLMAIPSWLIYTATGEYPNALTLFLLIVAVYFIWWEIDFQGWRKWDSIEDTVFVALGASLFLIIDMNEVLGRLSLWLAVTGCALLLGIRARLR